MQSSAYPVALLAFATAAVSSIQAEVITGRVVDSRGIGVAGVDIDVENNGSGGDPDVFNDGTDAGGFFTTTVAQPGIYDIVFDPPPPPLTTHLRVRLRDAIVAGTRNLGSIVLPPGVSLSGRVLNAARLPVANVNLDAIDASTGLAVELARDRTDALGRLSLAVPSRLALRIDPSTVVGALLAPRELDLDLAGNTALADIVLEAGFRVTGAVRSGGIPVAGADLDFNDSATGAELFTPGDNTNASGLFSVVVPARTYDVRVCPKPLDRVVAVEAQGVRIASNLDAGLINLPPGLVLSGSVRDCNGAPVQGVDVDVVKIPGQLVTLCRDDTDELGHYSVIVPAGTLAVQFSHSGLGSDRHIGVAVSADSSLDGTLPCCPGASASVRNGSGLNAQRYSNVTPPRFGTTWRTTVDCSGHASGLAIQVARGLPATGSILSAGQVLIAGPRLFSLAVPHAGGTVAFDDPIPDNQALCGFTAHTQVLILGSPGPELTNAIDATLGE